MKRYHFLLIIPLIVALHFSSAALAERLAISGSVANIRSGPGEGYDIIGKLGKYHPILVIERSGEWIFFSDQEDGTGWIHHTLAGEIPTVITKTTKCNIRSGPGIFHRKLATVGKGIPFKVIKREGEWLNIEHSGGLIGWIHEGLVW